MYLWRNQQYLYTSLNIYHSIYNGSTGDINTLVPSCNLPNVTFAIYYIHCKVDSTSPNYHLTIYLTNAKKYVLFSTQSNDILYACLIYDSGSYFNMTNNTSAGTNWYYYPNLNNTQTYSYYTGFNTSYSVTINGLYIA